MLSTLPENGRTVSLPENIGSESYLYVNKTIFRKPVGYIGVLKLAEGEVLDGDVIPYDIIGVITYGSAEIIINNEPIVLTAGDVFIIPAYSANSISAFEDVKMIFTITQK